MKKILIALALLLTLTVGAGAAAQKHRHTPQQEELADTTSKGAVEVYSDTTSVDTAGTDTTFDDEPLDPMRHGWLRGFMSEVDGEDIAGMLFVLAVLFIVFVLAPVLIIIALFYFINKNRKQKLKLAQMAMQQGQPIPEQLLKDTPESIDDEYQKGMRQCFVGVGLMIFLGYAAGQVGFGVGALVSCIGLGKVFASRTSRRRNELNDNLNNNDNLKDLTHHD